MDYFKSIDASIDADMSYDKIARKIFLTYPTFAFIGNEEIQYDILNSISQEFSIPITSIHVAGSSKIGRSIHKERDFILGTSDLDIAIIDTNFFAYCMEVVFKASNYYRDRAKFPIKNGTSTYQTYIEYIAKGIFRPDLMPMGEDRATWNSFFNRLSGKHIDTFKSINAGVYMSQACFEFKQSSVINNYIRIKENM